MHWVFRSGVWHGKVACVASVCWWTQRGACDETYRRISGMCCLFVRVSVLGVCGCDQSSRQQDWCRGHGSDRSWSAWRAVADVAGVRDAGVGDVHDGARTGGGV